MDKITKPINMENVFEGRDFMYVVAGAGGGFLLAKAFSKSIWMFCAIGAGAGFVYSKMRKD